MNNKGVRRKNLSLRLVEKEELGRSIYLLKLRVREGDILPPVMAGQFVQVLPPSGGGLLRRPISICRVIPVLGELWLLIAKVGSGTEAITNSRVGDLLDLILPLGNGFSAVTSTDAPLLIGGGVGIAPMLALAESFAARGVRPSVLLGGRSPEHIVLRADFEALSNLYITTEEGSLGLHGRVTDHPVLQSGNYDRVYCCGPMPMMKAVAALVESRGIVCEVSLENTMACGIGACLCCVQELEGKGNTCVCVEGPVFNSKDIRW